MNNAERVLIHMPFWAALIAIEEQMAGQDSISSILTSIKVYRVHTAIFVILCNKITAFREDAELRGNYRMECGHKSEPGIDTSFIAVS